MNESNATILNVDDNEDVLYLRSYLLHRAGFRVLEAVTGLEALRLSASERPEVALLDVNLPDLSGTDVCRRIKSAPETASTLVIQISSKFVRSSDRLEGLESGADSYLVDPIEPEILIATIRSLLRLRRTLEQTRKQEKTIDALLEYIPEGIAIADAPDFTVHKVSQYGLDMLRASRAHGIEARIDLDSIDSFLPRDRGIMLYRVIQEALTNVARHAGAHSVGVSVKVGPSRIDGSIVDDGTGLIPLNTPGPDNGLGLKNMRERMRILGGILDITSLHDEGTAVSFSIPIVAA